MGSESSTIQTDTTTNNTTTNTVTTTNNYYNNTYNIHAAFPQITSPTEQKVLVHDVSGGPVLAYSVPELQRINNNHESEDMINATLDNERKSSKIDKKQYLQSAILNCGHTSVKPNSVRQTFQQNKWRFKEDDFNDICNNLFKIENLKERLDTIQIVRICLEENINSELDENRSNANIFFHFLDVINDLLKATKETVDQQKFNEEQYYYFEEEQQQQQFYQQSSTTSDATEIVPYGNTDEQIALLNSFNYEHELID